MSPTDYSKNPHAMPLSRALDDVPLGITEQEIEPGIVARRVQYGPAPEPPQQEPVLWEDIARDAAEELAKWIGPAPEPPQPSAPVLWEDIAREAAEEIVKWIGPAPLSRHELAQAQHWARILTRSLALIDGRGR